MIVVYKLYKFTLGQLELGRHLLVSQDIGLHPINPPTAPHVDGDDLDKLGFEATGRLEIPLELASQLVELVRILAGNDNVRRSEAVLNGI